MFGVVTGNARIQSLAGAHGVIQRGHRFFNWRFRVGAVGIKDVHVLELHALEALVQAGEKMFARTPIAIRPRPHVPTSLGADDEFVAMVNEIAMENAAKFSSAEPGGGP